MGADSGWRRVLRYTEDELLILKIEYADGKHRFEVVEIPQGPGARKLFVEVP